ncbi:MAG: hypothetical protein ACRDZ7_02815, partial [Acidimicrobiia bacterium]
MGAAHRRAAALAGVATLAFLTGSVSWSGATPLDPARPAVAELAEGIAGLGVDVGIPLDPAGVLARAGLAPALVTRLAGAVDGLRACGAATTR